MSAKPDPADVVAKRVLNMGRPDACSLVCPTCGLVLDADGAGLNCRRCHKRWPVIDGVPHFVQEFPYWGEIPRDRMREVNAAARAGSWRTSLLEAADPDVRRVSEMILNLDRANWHRLIDLPAHSIALDLGAGTGTNSHALGLRYREVVAVEPVLERVQFMQTRFRQEGLSNIRVIRTSLWDLPFAPESFDLVAMNGVLEWVAEGLPGDPAAFQRKALDKARSLLRPGGYFYLGIENRLCLGYLTGYPDPHCGLPFVTTLPRPLAHWYARRRGLPNGYRNYLYTSWGYKKLLKAAGFTDIQIYLALPSYNHPKFFIPLEGNAYNYYSRNFGGSPPSGIRAAAHAALMKLDMLKHFEFSFAILGRA